MIFAHRPLLAAMLLSVGLLTACNNDDPAAPAAAQSSTTTAATATDGTPSVDAEGKAASGTTAQAPVTTPEPAADPTPPPAKPRPRPKPTPKPSEPRPLPEPQARSVCEDCGTVASITPVTRQGEAGAAGTLGGAVIGGIIGHQFGGGRGKDLATVAGAAGGAFAGREIEKRARATTVYEIGVRMENGGYRTVTVADPAGVSVGSNVRVSGNNLIPR